MPPRREPSRAQISHGLTYVAQKPSFLANFGQPPPSEREPIPTRPDEGEWAEDSDEDDWDKKFGGDEDGPQVVVLKEGRHLSADEVARERRRAKGERTPSPEAEPSVKPSSASIGKEPAKESTTTVKPGPIQHKAKRKLVGEAAEQDDKTDKTTDKAKKKKKKANKQMLSFDEAEGE
ncbi:hypothetical protein CC85DRAFT_305630 [Cutaneotrichosporon oleaginosum]|uniref:DUF4604 domain-containing protein n=1 Tax=Cutaneotrichosporon oleaginosum TaxID=879819 RepID=A0A0J0XCL2_9TREE|nr:uncharacterized protein CC85DRAFT_305630 [Cutaneotrichosporon oleaginosum]KLT38805.1 hypothetical protein CC85DRAFT_305630 [Cutaneotrichosporon oleaginosum]TXT06213.1 hypothetical protein COLE_05544 [Cutaneotrichosporon oleaginosum]